MYDITLIFTQHEETGNCNSFQLLNIIEKVGPDVIFEELSYINFNKSYEQESLFTLETSAIKLYLINHNVEHIPVDTYPLPKTYDEDLNLMYDKLFNSNMINESHNLCNLLDHIKTLTNQNGFGFLNSVEYDKYFKEFDLLKEKKLNILNDENLSRIYRLEKEMIAKRESQIIKNIYNFSKENSYNKAVMFIGAGHRKSFIELIKEVEIQETIKLNWNYVGN